MQTHNHTSILKLIDQSEMRRAENADYIVELAKYGETAGRFDPRLKNSDPEEYLNDVYPEVIEDRNAKNKKIEDTNKAIKKINRKILKSYGAAISFSLLLGTGVGIIDYNSQKGEKDAFSSAMNGIYTLLVSTAALSFRTHFKYKKDEMTAYNMEIENKAFAEKPISYDHAIDAITALRDNKPNIFSENPHAILPAEHIIKRIASKYDKSMTA